VLGPAVRGQTVRDRPNRRHRTFSRSFASPGGTYLPCVEFPRPLNQSEKDTTRAILTGAGVDQLERLCEQVEHAEATSPCGCGCPSVFITVDPAGASPTTHTDRVVVDAQYDGGAVDVCIEDGWISNLEVHWQTPETPTRFPAVSAFRSFAIE
jgi:hypothetical protein